MSLVFAIPLAAFVLKETLPWPYGVGPIQTGRLRRSDRICKYNQLLRIEEQPGKSAVYAGTL